MPTGLNFAAQLPDPGRLWIRYSPRSWPWPEGLRQDFARAALAGPAAGRGEIAALAADTAPDDVVYLPAVGPDLAGDRERLATALAEGGAPVLVQVAPGEAPPAAPAVAVHDLLPPLLGRDLAALAALPAEAAAVWPLIAGLTDDPGLWREGLSALAEGAPARVQAVVPELTPAQRRHLAERAGEEAFDDLFHRPAPAERDFARLAAAHGLRPFLERPLPAGPPRLRANRRLGAELALAGELWLRLGRSEAQGQALYRAARLADRFERDLEALAREGNLGVVGWLDDTGRGLVTDLLASSRSRLLAELESEYLAGTSHQGPFR